MKVFPISMTIAVSVLWFVLYSKKKRNYDEDEVKNVDSQERKPKKNEKDNCKTRSKPK